MVVEVLDSILFKGYTHLKRGSGFTTISEKLLNQPICKQLNIKEEIRKLFVTYYSDKIDVSNNIE